jgi:hypothetical protein
VFDPLVQVEHFCPGIAELLTESCSVGCQRRIGIAERCVICLEFGVLPLEGLYLIIEKADEVFCSAAKNPLWEIGGSPFDGPACGRAGRFARSWPFSVAGCQSGAVFSARVHLECDMKKENFSWRYQRLSTNDMKKVCRLNQVLAFCEKCDMKRVDLIAESRELSGARL